MEIRTAADIRAFVRDTPPDRQAAYFASPEGRATARRLSLELAGRENVRVTAGTSGDDQLITQFIMRAVDPSRAIALDGRFGRRESLTQALRIQGALDVPDGDLRQRFFRATAAELGRDTPTTLGNEVPRQIASREAVRTASTSEAVVARRRAVDEALQAQARPRPDATPAAITPDTVQNFVSTTTDPQRQANYRRVGDAIRGADGTTREQLIDRTLAGLGPAGPERNRRLLEFLHHNEGQGNAALLARLRTSDPAAFASLQQDLLRQHATGTRYAYSAADLRELVPRTARPPTAPEGIPQGQFNEHWANLRIQSLRDVPANELTADDAKFAMRYARTPEHVFRSLDGMDGTRRQALRVAAAEELRSVLGETGDVGGERIARLRAAYESNLFGATAAGQPRVQARREFLRDVVSDVLTSGQPAQRAAMLAGLVADTPTFRVSGSDTPSRVHPMLLDVPADRRAALLAALPAGPRRDALAAAWR